MAIQHVQGCSYVYCGSKIMKIPSLDKEFPSQHRDQEFALAIQ